MKTHIQVSKSFQLLFFAMLLLPLASLFLTSCEKETVYVEVPVEVPIEVPVDTCNRPDEVNDLIAFLHPLHQALYVSPQYVDIALTQLNAQPMSDGNFSMLGKNPEGEDREIIFRVELVDEFMAFEISNEVDPQNPELIQQFTEKGTSYRVYKNAKCGTPSTAFESLCEKKADGTSVKRSWYRGSYCERGNGFCTEALSVKGRQTTYFNDNCQGPIKSEESLYRYLCQ